MLLTALHFCLIGLAVVPLFYVVHKPTSIMSKVVFCVLTSEMIGLMLMLAAYLAERCPDLLNVFFPLILNFALDSVQNV